MQVPGHCITSAVGFRPAETNGGHCSPTFCSLASSFPSASSNEQESSAASIMSIEEALLEFRDKEQASDTLKANWYTIAAVALAAASAGHEVPALYRIATKDLDLEMQKLVQRRIKEAILKTSCLYGNPKALQALFPLFKQLKDEEIDHYGPRYGSLNTPNITKLREDRGKRFFEKLWTPEAAKANQDYNMKYCPDLHLMVTSHLEWLITEDAILNFLETELVMTAALICSNAPQQAMWHTRGIVRQGGTKEQAKFVHEIALKIAKIYDAKTGTITAVEDIDFEDSTPHT